MDEMERLKKIIAEELSVDEAEITEETSCADDLGADSIDLFQVLMAVEEEFGVELEGEVGEQIKTVGDALQFVKENQ